MANIIGLCGRKGAGKSLVARLLVMEMKGHKLSFADPLRDMLRAGLGLTDEDFAPERKEVDIPRLGCSPRKLMQTLGTDWGRKMIGEMLWSDLAEKRASGYLASGVDVVFDDVRFPSEAAVIRKLGGKVIHVVRPGFMTDQRFAGHESENGLPAEWIFGTLVNDCENELELLIRVRLLLYPRG